MPTFEQAKTRYFHWWFLHSESNTTFLSSNQDHDFHKSPKRTLKSPTKSSLERLSETKFIFAGYKGDFREHECKQPRNRTCCGKAKIVFVPPRNHQKSLCSCGLTFQVNIPVYHKAQLVSIIYQFWVLTRSLCHWILIGLVTSFSPSSQVWKSDLQFSHVT